MQERRGGRKLERRGERHLRYQIRYPLQKIKNGRREILGLSQMK